MAKMGQKRQTQKKPVKKKREAIGKVKARVWDVFSRYIRLRDCLETTGSPEYGECITCGGNFEFKELQAGHFMSKRSGNYFSEKGVHAQCRTCNLYGRNGYPAGMQLEYRRQIIEIYGAGYDVALEVEAHRIKKFTVADLLELEQDLKNKIRGLEHGYNGT